MTTDSINNIIIFDGVCNFCNASVLFIIRQDKKRIFKFLAMQSVKTDEIFKQYNIHSTNLDTVILIKEKNVFTQSDAALEIAKTLNFPWKVFYFFIFIPKFVRNRIYKFIANNRYSWFGKRGTCLVPTDEVKTRFLEY